MGEWGVEEEEESHLINDLKRPADSRFMMTTYFGSYYYCGMPQ
jgi:hypothetical protein